MEHIVYLALGSNLGNRLANLKAAVSNLSPQLSVKKKSSVYETPPWGVKDQAAFLNQVVMTETYLEPEALLAHLKRLEAALGRVPSFENGPRLIDIDILFFDDEIIDTHSIAIPHPRLHKRAFVLVPLAELAPDHLHPVLRRTMSDLLGDVDRSEINLFEGK
ncbi:MAG TPA: 2-amino-4-hydroxy-6-hydroxymethyldihydropteridine diphosphokinase [Anaerolineales bacterium]|nr:2-amino-4-hydroxy-6-hydroxymethyldihydropteridine diphosphokinase [Anaerolineales bacterium]